MDGYGISKKTEGNAIILAKKPNLDNYFKNFPNTTLGASGPSVGLLAGQMGNSEVGHLNIGAGRIIKQSSLRITDDINSGEFFKNKELLNVINYCKKNNKDLHLLGLLSDGAVHSLDDHLYALLLLAKKNNLKKVYIHCVLDGRDALPRSAKKYLDVLNRKIQEIGVGKIATIVGRYYVMDRDGVWNRTEKAYNALIFSEGQKYENYKEALSDSYKKGVSDEFFEPSIIIEKRRPIANIKKNDALILFNFRGDRARQICRSFISDDKDFTEFKRKNGYFNFKIVSLTEYDRNFKKIKVAYKPIKIKNTFGEFVSSKGYKQIRIAETTKYAHVTFFFNGGIEKPYKNEDRKLVPSPLVATFDLKPEMSADEIAENTVKAIKSNKYDFIILNYANGDMVGHSSRMKPTIKAIETVDRCVGRVVEETLDKGGVALITADHGNAEQLIDYKTGKEMTAHTINPVPLIIAGLDYPVKLVKGVLADIVPTILDIANIKKPKEMSGKSLIIKK